MATELATAYLSLIPTLKGAGKSIQSELDGINVDPSGKKMDKQLGNGLVDGAKSGGAGIMSALGGIAKVAGPMIAAVGFGQLVSEAAAATDATQKFKSTLDFAGLGTPEIEALSKSTRRYADETVYALSDIQNITAQLAANSVPNYDRLAEAAGNLNAVAGGNAQTFQSVGMVLTQTAGAGKLTTENWNQLAEAIPGASGKLQEAMLKNGAYTGNFREAMERGEITAAEFNDAIMQLGFQDAAIQAAKSTATFEGAFGNLRAAAVGGLSDALATIQPLVTGAINGLTPMVEGAFGIVNQGVRLFMDGMTAAGEYFAPFMQSITELVQANMPAIQAAWSSAMSAIQSVTQAVWPVIDAVIQTAMGVIQGVISTVLALISGDWSGVWNGIFDILDSIWNGMVSIVQTYIGLLSGAIDSALGFIQGAWNTAWSALGSFLDSAWNGIVSAVSGGSEQVMSVLGDLPSKIIGIFAGAGSWLIDSGRALLQGFADGVMGAVGWVGDQISGALGTIRGLFPFSPAKDGPFSGRGWVLYSGISIAEALGEGFTSMVPATIRKLKSGMESVHGAFEDAVPAPRAAIDLRAMPAGRMAPAGDGAAVIAWLERNLGDIISDRTPVMGSRDFARMSRRAVAYEI